LLGVRRQVEDCERLIERKGWEVAERYVDDDVSAYKFLNVQAYATGTSYMRVEIKSNGEQINLHSGYPMTSFKLKEGFNVYKVPLSSFSQPAWVQGTRIDPEDILKALTSITLSVFCDDCRPTSGTVVVDNLVFEK